MKKALVALVLACGVGVIAFASLSNRSDTKQAIEKKEKKDVKKKKECSRTCMFG